MLGFDLKALALGAVIGAFLMSSLGNIGGVLWGLTPFSAESKLDKARALNVDLGRQVTACTAVAGEYRASEALRIGAAVAAATESKVDVEDATARWGATCNAAFNSGLAAGKAIASKGGPRAPQGSPGSAPVPPAVGLSYRDVWSERAFRPAGAAAP
jgi:hypothetical protein